MVVCQYLHIAGCLAAAFQELRGALPSVVGDAADLWILHCWLRYPFLGLGRVRLDGAFVAHHAHRAAGNVIFPLHDRNAVLQKAGHFSAAAADRCYWEKNHADHYANYLRVYDRCTRHRAAAFCGIYHSYRNNRTVLHLPNSKVDN